MDALLTEGLPPGWAHAPIGRLCALQNGRAFKPEDWEAEGLPIVRIQNLNNRRAAFNRYSGAVAEHHRIRNGDLLFAWSGTPGTSFGAHVWRGGDAVLNQHIFRVDFDATAIDRDYFCHALNFSLEAFIAQSHGGAGLAHITKGRLEETTIPLAPRREQARIASAISDALDEIQSGEAALARAREGLTQFRASLLHAACTGALTADWRAANPVDSSPEQLLALIAKERTSKVAKRYREAAPPDGPPPFDLPQNWGWATMDQVCWQIDYGSSARCRPMPDGVPVLRMGNIQAGRLDYTDLKHLPLDHDEFPDLLLEPGDLLFNRTNSAELVGKTAVFEGHHRPVSFASYIVRAKAVRVRPQFLAHYINAPLGRQWIASVMTQQVGQANVSGGRLRTLCIPVPPLPEQDEIVARLADSFDVARDAALGASGVEQAAQLRQSILHAAFTGRLVPQDPADEPAAALLARLRAAPTTTRRPRQRRAVAQPDLIETPA